MVIDIYGIVNKENNKIYIGQTRQGYKKRFSQHLMPSDGSPLLRNAVKKYGAGSFECELLDIATSIEEANKKEKMWIYALGTYKKENGYNLSMGGTIGEFNQETLDKMSSLQMGENNSFFGKKHTDEAKKKMSTWKKEHYRLDNHPLAKKVLCVETGKVYDCVKVAELETGANAHHIGSVANKKYGRKTAGGYHWEWVN